MSDLTILYEDNSCIAVAKPGGLLTQGVPPGIPTLESMVKAYIKEKYHKPAGVYLGIPHRLDRPVSGVVLFARNTTAARRIAEQFQQHRVRKVYWAAVEGDVRPPEGEWEDWLRKVPEEARSEAVAPDAPGAKRAVLAYRVLGPLATGGTLLELTPRTGRMHQLRVQCAARGHPVIGDELYGSSRTFGPPAAERRDRVIALHARELSLEHPKGRAPLTLVAPLPEAWRGLGLPEGVEG
ncbi:MAG TPA: RluA family pseudouridine synthase [Gemmataceae bacterium]